MGQAVGVGERAVGGGTDSSERWEFTAALWLGAQAGTEAYSALSSPRWGRIARLWLLTLVPAVPVPLWGSVPHQWGGARASTDRSPRPHGTAHQAKVLEVRLVPPSVWTLGPPPGPTTGERQRCVPWPPTVWPLWASGLLSGARGEWQHQQDGAGRIPWDNRPGPDTALSAKSNSHSPTSPPAGPQGREAAPQPSKASTPRESQAWEEVLAVVISKQVLQPPLLRPGLPHTYILPLGQPPNWLSFS